MIPSRTNAPPQTAPGHLLSPRGQAAAGFMEINRRLAESDGLAVSEASRALVDLAVACIAPCRWAAITAWPPSRRLDSTHLKPAGAHAYAWLIDEAITRADAEFP